MLPGPAFESCFEEFELADPEGAGAGEGVGLGLGDCPEEPLLELLFEPLEVDVLDWFELELEPEDELLFEPLLVC